MPDRIAAFLIAAKPNAYCAVCLARALGVDVEAAAKTSDALARIDGYTMARRVCTLCGGIKLVITAD